MLTNGRGWVVFLWWVAACAVGGALAALDPTALFLGFPVFFGGLLGAAQALILGRYLPGVGAAWVAASFFGWVAGSVLQTFWYEAFSEAVFPGSGLLVRSIPWFLLGVGQAVALFATAGVRPSILAATWVLASVVGGTLTEAAVVLATRLFYDGLGETLGEYGINAVQLTVLFAILYAVPTGGVLVRVLRQTDVAETRDGARVAELARGSPDAPNRRVVPVSAGLLALLGFGFLGAWGVTNALGCGPGDRDAFAQFPQYADHEPELRSQLEMGACFARFPTDDPKEEVLDYYEERLRAHGWEVHRGKAAVTGRKGDDYYSVRYEDYRVPGGHPVTLNIHA